MTENKTILVTGGSGYIGSHAVVEFVKASYNCVIVDAFSNSSSDVIKQIEKIVGKSILYYQVDLLDKEKLDEIFTKHKFDAVIHFAGFKAVGESCREPLKYYHNNITGTIMLLECMKKHLVHKIIFSSSATVYGQPQYFPVDEKHLVGNCSNPYGTTKYVIELLLRDTAKADPKLQVVSLRYFNPVGAHQSGLIGENPNGIPANLMPFVTQVAIGRRKKLSIFGNDYDTVDGTGVRDYIHVVDLALGHLAAMQRIDTFAAGFYTYNLGTGSGLSVLQMVRAMEETSGREVPYELAPRRDGDVAAIYANCDLAEKELGWKATRGVKEMCRDAWNFQSKLSQ